MEVFFGLSAYTQRFYLSQLKNYLPSRIKVKYLRISGNVMFEDKFF